MVLSRRAAEAGAIEQGKERLQLALDAAELGVWEWDTASCRLTAGEGFQAIFGGEREPINQPWAGFLARVHRRTARGSRRRWKRRWRLADR